MTIIRPLFIAFSIISMTDDPSYRTSSPKTAEGRFFVRFAGKIWGFLYVQTLRNVLYLFHCDGLSIAVFHFQFSILLGGVFYG